MGEEAYEEVVDGAVNEAVDDSRELHGDIGDAFRHRRRKKVPVRGVQAAEEVAILWAQSLAVTKGYHDHRIDAMGKRLRTTQRADEGWGENARAAVFHACLGEGGNVSGENSHAVEKGVEEGEDDEDGKVILVVAEEKESRE